MALRTERAHQEAFIQVETPHVSNPQTTALTEALLAWTDQQHRHPGGDIQQILNPTPPSQGRRAGCDWGIPLR